MGIATVFSAPSAQAGANILLEMGLTAEIGGEFSADLLALSVFTPASAVDEVASFLQTLQNGKLDAAFTRRLAQYIARIPPEIWARYQLGRGTLLRDRSREGKRFADAATVAGIFAHPAFHPAQRLTLDGRVVVVMEASGVGERARPQGSRPETDGTEERGTTAPAPNKLRPEAPSTETLPATRATAQPLKSFSGEKGSYTVIGDIATAGQGMILLLEDGAHTKYAGKILRDPMQAQRLRDEATALSNIDNEHVVRLHDIAHIPHPVWGAIEMIVITEYVDGKTLAQLIQEGRRFTEAQLWEIARQAMDGLQAAHAKGITHRDIKPSNLMIVEKDDGTFTVKIVDYGFARFAGEARDRSSYSGLKGTFEYTTPEHFLPGLVFTNATDRYGLGLVLIDLIRGRLRDAYFKYDPPLKAIAEFRRTSGEYLSPEFLDNLAMLVDENPEVRRRAFSSPPLMGADRGERVITAAETASEMIPLGAAQYLQNLHDTEGDRRSAKDFRSRDLWDGLTTSGGFMVTAGALISYFTNFHESLVLTGIGTLPLLLGLWKQWQLRRLDSYVEASPIALYKDGKITGATLKEYRRGAVPLHPVDTAQDLKRMHAGTHIFLNHVVVEDVVVKKSTERREITITADRIPVPNSYTVTVFDLTYTIHLPWGDTIQQSLHTEDKKKVQGLVSLFQEGPVSLVGIAQDNGSIKITHVEKPHF